MPARFAKLGWLNPGARKICTLLLAEGQGRASPHPPVPWKSPLPQTPKAVSAAPGLSHCCRKLMRGGIVYYVGHSERGRVGRAGIHTPHLPSTDPTATASPLADLEVGGSSFLGREGEISVHLPSYYTPLYSALVSTALGGQFIQGCQLHSQRAWLCA